VPERYSRRLRGGRGPTCGADVLAIRPRLGFAAAEAGAESGSAGFAAPPEG